MPGATSTSVTPALFAAFPNTHPATLFGVNKSASLWGTAVATVQYARRVHMDWPVLLPAAALSLAGSLAGAWLVTVVSPEFLRKVLPFVLLAVPLGFVIPATLCGMGVARAFDEPLGWRSALVCGTIALLFWILFAQVLGVGLGPAVAWPL